MPPCAYKHLTNFDSKLKKNFTSVFENVNIISMKLCIELCCSLDLGGQCACTLKHRAVPGTSLCVS